MAFIDHCITFQNTFILQYSAAVYVTHGTYSCSMVIHSWSWFSVRLSVAWLEVTKQLANTTGQSTD